MEQFCYTKFISRNNFFIDKKLQKKIKNTKLVFVGCGLSSVLVELSARIGFENFFLCDGDRVDLTNLNRQNYYLSDIGKLKVDVLMEKLTNINSNIRVDFVSHNINDSSDIINVIDQGDIIINTIDCGALYFDLVHMGMAKNKLIVCPFNPGFGGLVVCFNKKSGTLFDLLKTNKIEDGLEFSKKLILNNDEIKLPQTMRNNIDQILENINENGYEPQIAIGVNMSSSIALTNIIKYLNNESIPYCPKFTYRGLYDLY